MNDLAQQIHQEHLQAFYGIAIAIFLFVLAVLTLLRSKHEDDEKREAPKQAPRPAIQEQIPMPSLGEVLDELIDAIPDHHKRNIVNVLENLETGADGMFVENGIAVAYKRTTLDTHEQIHDRLRILLNNHPRVDLTKFEKTIGVKILHVDRPPVSSPSLPDEDVIIGEEPS